MTSVLQAVSTWLPTTACRADHSTSKAWQPVVSSLAKQLHSSGFDIVEPLCTGWYNDAVQDSPEAQIPLSSLTGNETLAILIGNSRTFWKKFLVAYDQTASLQNSADPVEQYTEDTIQRLLSAEKLKCRIFFSHEETAGDSVHGYVAMQRLAECTGCAYNDHVSHLSLHPRYGPWFALRALVILEGIEYTGERKAKLPNPLSQQTESYVRTAVRSARTCSSSDLSAIVSQTGAEKEAVTAEAMRRQWKKWLAVRDAPFPGHPWRYPELMIEYHYTNERHALNQAIKIVKAQLRRGSLDL